MEKTKSEQKQLEETQFIDYSKAFEKNIEYKQKMPFLERMKILEEKRK